jgi:hypothetical protein
MERHGLGFDVYYFQERLRVLQSATAEADGFVASEQLVLSHALKVEAGLLSTAADGGSGLLERTSQAGRRRLASAGAATSDKENSPAPLERGRALARQRQEVGQSRERLTEYSAAAKRARTALQDVALVLSMAGANKVCIPCPAHHVSPV